MSYSQFAFYYDELTKNVDYKGRAKYFLSLLEKHGAKAGLTLDLACGTGSLTMELLKMGVDVFGVDSSPEMLMQAKDKAYDEEEDVLFLMQKMQNLDLYGKVDTVICALDSINHLKNEDELQKTFNRVSLFLNDDGHFIFDVNTIFKHRNILANNAFVYETDNVYCVWQNFLQEDDSVKISLDFFENQNGKYARSSESFSEQVFSPEILEKMLKKAGFEKPAIYNELSFDSPDEESQRLVFVAKKAGDEKNG